MDERCHNDVNQSSPYDSGSGINYNRLYSFFCFCQYVYTVHVSSIICHNGFSHWELVK